MKISKFSYIAFTIAFVCTNYLVQLPAPISKDNQKEDAKSLNAVADENYFAARSFPDNAISLNAYEKALLDAKLQMEDQKVQRGLLGNWTSEGPFNIGARINTIAVNPQNENIIYIGFSRGGVFKTTDGGKSWLPIFDKQPYLAIGDIELDPTNPNTIYVATGDPNIGYYSAIGDGVWKSTDAGATWTNIGLKEQRIISRFEVNPKNTKIMYAAAMGLPFQKNKNRGLYKTTDGGVTWAQKLFVSDSTGVCDFMMDSNNPNIIYASTWDRIRNNNQNIVSGQGAAVYKSIDGGDSWNKLGNGLPSGRFSRTGITMYEKNPNILYAVFVEEKTLNIEGIYRSINAGANWVKLADDFKTNDIPEEPFGGFGWYFAGIEVNPNDPNDIFILGVDLWRTKDGGNLWKLATPDWSLYEVHADKHDLVFSPTGKILLATDGGLYRSENDAINWEDIENIATTQFYRVAYNPNEPDLYYGGAQDNGTTAGNKNYTEWDRLYGGDGFQARFDKKRPNISYFESQNGSVVYSNDGVSFYNILRDSLFSEKKHWDCQYVLSKFEDGVIYYPTQKVWKSDFDPDDINLGINWHSISTDLTENEITPNITHTISTLEESPLEKGLLYAGTTNAKVWFYNPVTSTWKKINNGLPKRYITKVLPSENNKNTVFVSLSGYREFEDTPHIWRSDNQGTTWKNISGDLPPLAVNDILSLENNKDSVLFAATDGGVYFTKNSGKNWLRLGDNMPLIPVFDIEYNPVKNQIFAGTYARSIMSFDLKNVNLSNKSNPISSKDLNADSKISLYPTLFDNHLTINSLEQNITFVKIYNLQGKLLLNQSQNATQVTLENIDFPKGIYLVEIILENKNRIVKKVIKK